MNLELRGVSKRFSAQTALSGVDLSIKHGEVHALVGQNGSGKSTLIKILAGYHLPDTGTASCGGRAIELGNAKASRDVGMRFVHQDLGLVLSMSVLDNVMLGGQYPRGLLGRIRWREARERARSYLGVLGSLADPRAPAGSLSLAERAAVAIARALADASDERLLLVLDEPTAALPASDVGRLLDVIERLRAEQHGVLLVSHHLDEVLRISDRVTVLRDGAVVAALPIKDVDNEQLTELIVGHPVALADRAQRTASPRAHDVPEATNVPVFRVENLSGGRLRGIDIPVRAGEIVGVAGITGSGRESVVPLLSGAAMRIGTVEIAGQVVPPGRAHDALQMGMAHVPGERLRNGIFENLNVRENMTTGSLHRHVRLGRIQKGSERREARTWINRLGVAARSGESAILHLSGGNQQKVLVARALRQSPKVLLLDDPTMGIDIGAREQIHTIIAQCAADGMAVLIISTDSDELSRLADRVIVLARGRVFRIINRDDGLNAPAIDAAQLGLAAD
jgi:ribose transport system ATP-binding protein